LFSATEGNRDVWLLVGLGNPGKEYEDTRHNVGFRVVDLIARRVGAPAWRGKWGAEIAEAKLGRERVLLCKPMEFMNVSGQPVVRVASFWKIDLAHTVVVHDDLDVAFGRIKLAQGGGHGGNNGVRSILAEWGAADFHRVRIGIGRPAPGRDASSWVLSGFGEDDRRELPGVLERAADAASCIVTDGAQVAMNRFNGKAAGGSNKPAEATSAGRKPRDTTSGRKPDGGDDT
jgi:PTH1 family peptidyl-tRNA hydrolase